jgi:hypothetical protein
MRTGLISPLSIRKARISFSPIWNPTRYPRPICVASYASACLSSLPRNS